MTTYVYAFRSEWLKRKRSFASLMILGGALFTPSVIAAVRLLRQEHLPRIYAAADFWPKLWRDSWESMAVFFLPLGAILATSLITQIEFRGNAWKQVHTLPVSTTALFVSKLTVILLMIVQFLVLFAAAVYASAMIPYLLVSGVPMPQGSFLALPLARDSAIYFLATLPIVAAQYLMALRANNILIPIGIGFLAWVGAVAAVSSKFALWWPYGYTIVQYLKDSPKGKHLAAYAEMPWLPVAFFAVIAIAAFVLFVTKAEKG
jgi:lantibiotic transport system permease protein